MESDLEKHIWAVEKRKKTRFFYWNLELGGLKHCYCDPKWTPQPKSLSEHICLCNTEKRLRIIVSELLLC